ncbi:diguanylate cyclase domain-containing protein [Bacillus salitolerans]|uniref:Diguanylate cyclase domain-containing protein n=1 Tax=Bacillus salitolerans TaxID=1437434 RepID=A0ABW4LRF5_9BACI
MKENNKIIIIIQSILLLLLLISNLLIDYWIVECMVNLLLIAGIAIINIRSLHHHNQLSTNIKKLREETVALEQIVGTLQEETEDYDLLFNSLHGAVFSIDYINNRVRFSKGAEQIFGYSSEMLIKDPTIYKEIIHPDDIKYIDIHESKLKVGRSSKVEFRISLPEGPEKWVVQTATPVQDQDGTVTKIIGQIFDITKQVKLEQKLKQLAYYDDLTDLPNRKALDRHIQKALARSKRHEHNFTLMFIDLDDFKKVNDTMGHEAGDVLLKEVVKRINDCIRDEDLISRIGGDEFIIVFEETNKDVIEDIAERILEFVAEPYHIHDQEVKISLSIGVSMYPDDGTDKETLIDHADKAMYYAKHNGKNNYKIYTPDLNTTDLKKGLLEKWVDAIQKFTNF